MTNKTVFHIRYPFLEDWKEALTDNRKQAIASAMSLYKEACEASTFFTNQNRYRYKVTKAIV